MMSKLVNPQLTIREQHHYPNRNSFFYIGTSGHISGDEYVFVKNETRDIIQT